MSLHPEAEQGALQKMDGWFARLKWLRLAWANLFLSMGMNYSQIISPGWDWAIAIPSWGALILGVGFLVKARRT